MEDIRLYAPGVGFIGIDETDQYGIIQYICRDCAASECGECECCGNVVYAWEAESTYEHDCLCKECYEGSTIIHPWEWKPTPIFKLSKKNPKMVKDKLLYGVEVEIESCGNNLKYHIAHALVEEFGDYIYPKEDATIRNGIEIVSHPFSWQDYRDRRDMWKSMFQMVKDYRYGADEFNNVGMHVHMSKNAFTKFHLYKFLSFIYAGGNRSFVEGVAQRHDHDYAMFCSQDCRADGIKYNAKHKDNNSEERHSAVNLTGDNTVEVRIFQSTIELALFSKNLEFLQSLFDFTKNTKNNHINVPHYWNYMTSKYSLFGNNKPEEVE
jgi:hypothetical protein